MFGLAKVVVRPSAFQRARSFSSTKLVQQDVKAAVIREKGGPYIIERLQLDEPREDEVMVKIAAVGYCHTDTASLLGYIPTPLPIVLGHEGAGVVQSVGAKVTSVQPGDHVVMSYTFCGGCKNCLSSRPSYCSHHRASNFGGKRLADGSLPFKDAIGQAVHGCYFGQSSFASHSLCRETNVVKVPRELPLQSLAPLGCSVQTGAGAVINSLKVPFGSAVAVFGCGPVGMSSIMASAAVGASTVIAVDLHRSRLDLARTLGATHVVDASNENVVEAVRQITGGGLDFSIDTTGNVKVLTQAMESLPPTGVACLLGGSPPGSKSEIDMLTILLGRTVRGVIQGDSVSKLFLPRIVELHRQGKFPFDKMITYYDGLEQLNQARKDADEGRTVKPVIRVALP
eukprot:TRINITY_DN6939_c0_g1_i2.p1 TRINITY_DN6939_c0_g1~~TRINITY_DN6939_c0_g1_i2.p1  ORF type:complete len:398 (-),score=112.40 TRINITY_DN6939_c0_g1_i2:1017-2210(-)